MIVINRDERAVHNVRMLLPGIGLWLVLIVFCPRPALALVESSASDVFAQALRIQQEVDIIADHFGITEKGEVDPIRLPLKPRNVWQKTYEIMVKINIMRVKNRLPRLEEGNLEPVKNLNPSLVYEQTQLILAQLAIFKYRLGIQGEAAPASKVSGKQPIDVFNLLNRISYRLDIINGEGFTPSSVFSQAMRILDDVDAILARLKMRDRTEPPNKSYDDQPKDVFNACLRVINEVQRLQRMSGIEEVDFRGFQHRADITPSDVFNLAVMIMAELQPIKAYLGMKHHVSTPARYYSGKLPGDVKQVLIWALRKLKQIRTLDR